MANDSIAQPHFQKLQQQFAEHIRNPEKPYAPKGEQQIEPRRLEVYESLFFNNVEGFFNSLFPVTSAVLGEDRWQQLMREYMIKHRARTPLFHRLGEEFLAFLNDSYEPQQQDPTFLLELAHYEWVELALGISPEEADSNPTGLKADLQQAYQLSPVAWPLVYDWPVQQISVDYQPETAPEQVTTLLVFRNADDRVEFMEIAPLLYQWLTALNEADSARAALMPLTAELELDEAALEQFAVQTLQQLIDLNIIHPRNV
ncbi:putative DNA-binding domain-containing protein [Thiomicrorhabdus sp. ZW0627]|uniref:HvfC family RiPP maturation protein n=1 Tax=Thiomicrorhabdus sp. ZW0627 TaxID=3039774 RepID=UPI002436F856|nr:putative DNA-binding domain-containing protein [Thiomicrorhabdus sp. ZW0627]MDG6773730.1 putative DNA-binding domain-containing protein [Thiomicrorhabdus sp. ZW0627]